MYSREFILCIIVIIGVALFILVYKKIFNKESFDVSNYTDIKINGRTYHVRKDLNNHIAAAKILDTLHQKIKAIIVSLPTNDPRTLRIKQRYNLNNVYEGKPARDETSYSLNKGERIVFCLRPRENQEIFHQIYQLMYVVIHEMGHLASESVGHNDEFIENFKWLLKESVKTGLYQPENYKVHPFTYCGINVQDNPYYW